MRLERQHAAATVIAAHVRGTQARDLLMLHDAAAAALQAVFRTARARRRFERTRFAARRGCRNGWNDFDFRIEVV